MLKYLLSLIILTLLLLPFLAMQESVSDDLAASYDRVEEFEEGRAIVYQGDKAGVIDRLGRLVVEPKYDKIDSFKGGCAIVYSQRKAGLIDHAGHELLPVAYDKLILHGGQVLAYKGGHAEKVDL